MTIDSSAGDGVARDRPIDPGSVLVVGPGWLGATIAAAWSARGSQVWTLARGSRAEAESSGSHSPFDVRGDVRDAQDDAGLDRLLSLLPVRIAHVVLCVAPSRARGDDHAALYPAAARGAARLSASLGARSLLYTSSTGVYGAVDGSEVDEETPLASDNDRQAALVEAERGVLEAYPEEGNCRIVLRVAGLYGPGRDPSSRFRTVTPTGDPAGETHDRWCNFAWRDDVVSAVMHLQTAALTETGHRVFNCADGHPVRTSALRAALGAENGTGPGAPGRPVSAAGTRPSHQQVSVRRLLATGWRPAVPTVYHGLARLGHPVTAP